MPPAALSDMLYIAEVKPKKICNSMLIVPMHE